MKTWFSPFASIAILILVFTVRQPDQLDFWFFLAPIVWLACIYFITEWQTGLIYSLILQLTRNRKIAISWITLLLFPGTAIHELSHLFSASILGVRAGKFTLEPEPLKGEHVTIGSVMIADTDPFRRYAIGMAPVFSGIVILAAISYLLNPVLTVAAQQVISGNWVNRDTGLALILLYLIFSVSSAMFSSKEDLAGFTGFIAAVTAVTAPLVFLAARFGISMPAIPSGIEQVIRPVFGYLGTSLSLIIIIQAVSYLLLFFVSFLINIIIFNFRNSNRRGK